MGYPRFSAAIKAVLDAPEVDLRAEVSLLSDTFKSPPYVTVAQSQGTIAEATMTINIYGKTLEEAITISDKVYDALRNRKVGQYALSFRSVVETHIVRSETEVRAGVQMTYNVPVHLGNR